MDGHRLLLLLLLLRDDGYRGWLMVRWRRCLHGRLQHAHLLRRLRRWRRLGWRRRGHDDGRWRCCDLRHRTQLLGMLLLLRDSHGVDNALLLLLVTRTCSLPVAIVRRRLLVGRRRHASWLLLLWRL